MKKFIVVVFYILFVFATPTNASNSPDHKDSSGRLQTFNSAVSSIFRAADTEELPVMKWIQDVSAEQPLDFITLAAEAARLREQYAQYAIDFLTSPENSLEGRIEYTVPIADYYGEWIHIALVYRYKESFRNLKNLHVSKQTG